MNHHSFIAQLQPNQYVDGAYTVHNCQLGVSKTGKHFLKALLGDRTGQLAARMWTIDPEHFQTLPTDGFVRVSGMTQPYQGSLQVILEKIEAYAPSDEELQDLLPTSKHDIDKMFAAMFKVVETLQNPALKALALAYLNDEALMARFRRAPAAMSLHHAYIGGLLEHTLSLMRLAHVICPLHPQLNRDLVMVGLFLHDLGKCFELSWDAGFGYTEDGQLVGHIARGVLMLQRKADELEAAGTRLPAPVLRVLHHIILSHHGTPEFGALKVPATPEAIAVSLLDNLDAKLQMAIAATREGPAKAGELGGHFTDKVWALDTRLYRPDPTTLPDDAP